ncbi:MAG: DUF4097 family beta strand repeat protein [Candidatus Eisenbacteria bacterium]|nr:DUF4097 family beta strand repeat protein [Candidatus Eisenbacteria bacterium]
MNRFTPNVGNSTSPGRGAGTMRRTGNRLLNLGIADLAGACLTGVGFAGLTLFSLGLSFSDARAEFSETASLSGSALAVHNLIGKVTVEGYDGLEFQVTATVKGSDGSRENVRVESGSGADAHFRVVYPKREDDFVYPPLGYGSTTTFTLSEGEDDEHWLMQLFSGINGDRIRVRGHGKGLEAWADITVKVPRGKSVKVRLGVGEAVATNVDGDVDLAVHSGSLEGDHVRGELRLDSGSGSVLAREVDGDLWADTGSGNVLVDGVRGRKVTIDTGSGRVDASGIECDALAIDTGSGSIDALNCAADDARLDTGSGSIEAAFTRVGDGRFLFDTGSGSIDLHLPREATGDFEADTGAGNIRIEVHDPRNIEKGENNASFTLGSGAAHFKLDTGSGQIRITQEM